MTTNIKKAYADMSSTSGALWIKLCKKADKALELYIKTKVRLHCYRYWCKEKCNL